MSTAVGETAVGKMEGSFNTSILKQHIKEFLSRGLSVIPLKYRGKEPLVPWKEFQKRLPSIKEVEEWLRRFKNFNIAIVTGAVSGNLVVIDFDSEEKFKEFIAKVREDNTRLAEVLANTWIVKTGKGYHVYFRIEEHTFRTKPKLVADVDVKAEGGYVVAPPSIHPSGARYEFVRSREGVFGPPEVPEPITITENEWKKILKLLGAREVEKPREEKGRELADKEILEIVNMLREAYRPGQRDLIVFFLTGWLRKANVSYDSARRVVELLAEEDEEKDHRIYVLDRTYGLRGNPPSEYKGKTGLQEILEEVFGEEKALEVIRRIEEILGVSSPFYDSIIEILDYEKQLYAVANLRKLVVVRARRREKGLRYKERVCIGAPTKLTIYINPLGGLTKYEVVWKTSTRPRPLRIGPAPIEDIIGRLKAEGLVVSNRLVNDVIPALFNGYQRKGRAEVREEIESPGFYLVEGKIVSVRWEAKEVSEEDLREALELLNELAENWFSHVKERFATVIKWGLIAPFSYCLKQRGRWIPWLYLFGASYTGKTTLGEIILSIWGLDSRHRKSGSSIDTVPRLGHVLSCSTFPVLVNEPGNAIYREDVVEVMKSAVESTIARGKYVRGTYTEIPSLAPLVMTSNRAVPRDDALLRRILVIRFTYGERVSPEKASEFEKQVKPRLGKLGAIGYWVAQRIINEPKLLEMDWRDLAEKMLVEMFTAVGMEVPEWVKLSYENEDNVYEDIREAIRTYLLKRINEEYNRFVGKVYVETADDVKVMPRTEVEFEERVKIVLENRLLPWAILRGQDVLFTSDFARELRPVVGDIGGLKSIAELLGWEYYKFSYRVNGKTKNRATIRVKFNELLEFLELGEIDTKEL